MILRNAPKHLQMVVMLVTIDIPHLILPFTSLHPLHPRPRKLFLSPHPYPVPLPSKTHLPLSFRPSYPWPIYFLSLLTFFTFSFTLLCFFLYFTYILCLRVKQQRVGMIHLTMVTTFSIKTKAVSYIVVIIVNHLLLPFPFIFIHSRHSAPELLLQPVVTPSVTVVTDHHRHHIFFLPLPYCPLHSLISLSLLPQSH